MVRIIDEMCDVMLDIVERWMFCLEKYMFERFLELEWKFEIRNRGFFSLVFNVREGFFRFDDIL